MFPGKNFPRYINVGVYKCGLAGFMVLQNGCVIGNEGLLPSLPYPSVVISDPAAIGNSQLETGV